LPHAAPAKTETVRLVLLGASNVARCLPTALTTAKALAEHNHPGLPAQILVATGRGRSYGQTSGLLGRSLPGILQSGLWDALEQSPDGPTYALLTDVGNDVAYGVDPEVILSWLERCVRRLQTDQTRFAVTALPLDNLDRFPTAFLEAFRKTLFPSSTLPIAELLHRAELVDQGLRDLCNDHRLPIVEQPDRWFRFDPVHYRLGLRQSIWKTILDPWRPPEQPPAAIRPSRKHLFWRAWPEDSTVLGKQISRPQPCLHLLGDTPVSLF